MHAVALALALRVGSGAPPADVRAAGGGVAERGTSVRAVPSPHAPSPARASGDASPSGGASATGGAATTGGTATPDAAPTPEAPAPPRAKPVVLAWPPKLQRFTTWELSAEGGVGFSWDAQRHFLGFVRGRVGLLRVDNEWHRIAGLTVEWRSPGAVGVGMQAELLHQEQGVWAQLGFTLDVTPAVRPGAMLAVGWSLLGLEAQARQGLSGPAEVVLLAKLRVPVRHVLLALGVRPPNED